ncbi:histone H2A-Bbd type 1-like [Nannospalax galili]|uniref:histone H2A-Bbd type 1-like n=1 Tax=Nannospalax galili TaxID=1026970 RepID=UPI0004ED3444|nr:histone H2A-Bbd type 1-like [Nannospalax galili]
MSGKKQRQIISRSTTAELQFPVSRVDRFLREGNYAQRLSTSAPVFLAGVLECLTSNILVRAGEEPHSKRRNHITPEHVCQVVQNNRDLLKLFQDDTKSLALEVPEPNEN